MPYRRQFLPMRTLIAVASPGLPWDATWLLDVSCDDPPYRVVASSTPTYHCAASGQAAPQLTSKSATGNALKGLSSSHFEIDPAVGHVVLAFYEPVVSRVKRSDDVVFDGIADELVVALDPVSQSLPDVV